MIRTRASRTRGSAVGFVRRDRRAVLVGERQDLPAHDADAYRLECDDLTLAREVVRARTVDALGGVGGRDLVDRAREGRQRIEDRLALRQRGLADDGAVEILGVRLGAEADGGLVDLGLAGEVREEARGTPDEEHEQARGERVERARVADALLADGAAREAHDVV
jgi:hypothetical protein